MTHRHRPAPVVHSHPKLGHPHAKPPEVVSPANFWTDVESDLEQVALFASLMSAAAIAATPLIATTAPVFVPVTTLLALGVFYVLLADRWRREWLVYCAEASFTGAYFYYRARHAADLDPGVDATVLVLFSFLQFGFSEFCERRGWHFYSRPILYFSLAMTIVTLLLALARWRLDTVNMSIIFSAGAFYTLVSYRKRWKRAAYAAAVLYNVFLWIAWRRNGYTLADHPQYFLIPVGFTALLFAEVNRQELGRMALDGIRSVGSTLVYVSTAVPMWQFRSFGAWLTLLLLSLAGTLVGVALRVQSILWLALVCFVFDVVYQLGRVGMDHAQAKWIIMFVLGLALLVLVGLNEKMQIGRRVRAFYLVARAWE